jgi:hypothetical protein
VGTINDIWAVDNGGMTVVVDGYRSAKITMKGGLIEANSGAAAVYPGQAWRIEDIWFELNGSDIVPGAPESGSATTKTIVESCYFSSAQSVSFPTDCGQNIWINNKCPLGLSFTGAAATQNYIIEGPESDPAAPTMSAAAGTLTLSSANASARQNVLGEMSYNVIYNYTPAATGFIKITLSAPPTGWTYKQWYRESFDRRTATQARILLIQ